MNHQPDKKTIETADIEKMSCGFLLCTFLSQGWGRVDEGCRIGLKNL